MRKSMEKGYSISLKKNSGDLLYIRRGCFLLSIARSYGQKKGAKMYAAEFKSYNLSAKRDGETPPQPQPSLKKKRYESVSRPPRPVRILGRRYPLTSTSFKYLEIGISVGSVSDVEVIIGDNRGTQITLPTVTWKALMEENDDIQKLMDKLSSSPLWIRDLLVEICTISGSKLFKLTFSNNFLYLKPATMIRLLNLKNCVELTYVYLMENLPRVNLSFKTFVNFLEERNITNICYAEKAIRESEIFDDDSLIDCEILACNLNEIMYNVLNKK